MNESEGRVFTEGDFNELAGEERLVRGISEKNGVGTKSFVGVKKFSRNHLVVHDIYYTLLSVTFTIFKSDDTYRRGGDFYRIGKVL